MGWGWVGRVNLGEGVHIMKKVFFLRVPEVRLDQSRFSAFLWMSLGSELWLKEFS